MKEEMNYIEFIDRYLYGYMSDDEKAWFEKELEGNTELRKELEFHKQVNSVLADKDTMDLKMQLDQIHEEIAVTTKKHRLSSQRNMRIAFLSVAASVILLIGLTCTLSTWNYSSDHLIDKFYVSADVSSTYRNGEDVEDYSLAQAMNYYKNEQYSLAITLFEEILEKDEEALGIYLYSGISYLEVQDYKIANKRFTSIIEQDPNPFVESATWYLGMCYLFTDDKEKARETFEKLVKQDGYYKKDAKKILRRI